MKIELSEKEKQILSEAAIAITNKDYTEDEVFELLDRIRDIEIRYGQDADKNKHSHAMYLEYGNIADKIQEMIPEQ